MSAVNGTPSLPSFLMPALKHLLSLQKRHWFLLSLSTMHCLLNLNTRDYSDICCNILLRFRIVDRGWKVNVTSLDIILESNYLHFHSAIMFLLFVPASVDMILSNGAPKEAFTTVTARGSIVFPCSFVSTDGTVGVDHLRTGHARLCRHVVWRKKQSHSLNTQGANTHSESVTWGLIMGPCSCLQHWCTY